MGNVGQMSTMEREILMSRESENIVRQWEEQKIIKREGDKLDKMFKRIAEGMKPKPKPKKKKK